MVPRSAVVFFLLVVIAAVSATNVKQCEGRSIDNLSSKVQLSPCKKPPCKLKKGTEQHITIGFTPETPIPDLKNSVSADIFGVRLPFVGVDGNSVCDKIYTEAGDKASCPLEAGTNYVYKDSFPILSFYPTVTLEVHWALKPEKGTEVTCFKVPAKITS